MSTKFRVGEDGRIHKHQRKEFPNGSIYDCEFVNGKPDGNGTFESKDLKYQGTFARGMYHGQGSIDFIDGSSFQGHFVYGKRHGPGKMIDISEGVTYIGDFVDDRIEGSGVMTSTKGERKEGHWRNGKLHGEDCKVRFDNGDEYEGGIQYGRLHSDTGHIQYSKGRGSYTGSFDNGMKSGVGTRIYIDGQIYRGDWRSNQLHGFGTMYYSKTTASKFRKRFQKYVGEWNSGLYCGRGQLFFDDTSEYVSYNGCFMKNLFDGEGELTYRDGGSYIGNFREGKRDGQGKRVWATGNFFDGIWSSDRMIKGTYFNKDRCSTYVGSFQDDKKNGQGKETWRSADDKPFRDPCFQWIHKVDEICKYEGEYKNGYFHGHGCFQSSDGRMFQGSFHHGKPHGFGEVVFIPTEHYGDKTKMHIGDHGSLYRVWRYVGQWEHGKRTKGILYYLDGSKRQYP